MDRKLCFKTEGFENQRLRMNTNFSYDEIA